MTVTSYFVLYVLEATDLNGEFPPV